MLTILLRASLIRSSGIGAFPIKSARVDLEACRKGVSERDPALIKCKRTDTGLSQIYTLRYRP